MMTRISFSVAAAILIAMPLSPAQAGTITVTDEARTKIQDLDARAAALAVAADQFTMIVRNTQLAPTSHLEQLIAIREDVNAMGREIATLNGEHEALPPWEQRTIARTLPLLKDAAANAEKAIEFFNANRVHLWAGAEYRHYADQICKDSEQMQKELAENLELARLQNKEHHLKGTLDTESGE